MNKYIVKPEDLIGDIEGFPIEVVQKMVDYQEVPDVTVFQRTSYEGTPRGFTWSVSSEGGDFWNDVILNTDFQKFFQKYPKQEFDIVLTHSNGFQIFREPVLMEVSCTSTFITTVERYIFGKKYNKYYAWGDTVDGDVHIWQYVRPIQQPKEEPIIELTLQQIAEKFNIDSSKLRIKE